MKKFMFAAVFAVAFATAAAQTRVIPLWPDGPTEDNGITAPEHTDANGTVTNVSEASIAVWPAGGENTGIAVIICPGGGYGAEVARHEGTEFASWLASNGITAAVLKYRLPNGRHGIPLADAQQAVRAMRAAAPDLGVDPDRIGVMGFSAGGHLASTLLTHYDKSSRPAFGILFYPVVTMTLQTHGGSRKNLLGENPSPEMISLYSNERQVTPDTPPTLVFFSEDDTVVPPVNGSMFREALEKNGVANKLVLYPTGEHGWGFNKSFEYHEQMKAEVLDWIHNP